MSRVVDDAEPPSISVPQEHFEKLYADKPDPWDLATKWYDRRKYAITVAALPRERYRNCFEPGCSIGELTRMLAVRCDRLLAVDFVAAAVARARAAIREFSHVRVEHATLPRDLPEGEYDLIVVSEILYYLSAIDLEKVLDGLVDRLEPDGDIVVVHHRAVDCYHGYDGFNVHHALTAYPQLTRVVHVEDENFILDVLRRETHTA